MFFGNWGKHFFKLVGSIVSIMDKINIKKGTQST